MLPPDNFQEDPKPVIANRTSPTNLGLYLLSVVAARDFGWLGLLDATERLEETLSTMGKLERFRGHFFNWYDTSNLRALDPKYVSSVDSGNLAGHLIALRNACREITTGCVVNPRWLSGLEDTLELIRESLPVRVAGSREVAGGKLSTAIDVFAASIQNAPSTPASIAKLLAGLARQAESIRGLAHEQVVDGNNTEDAKTKVVVWSEALCVSVRAHQRDIDFLMPWAGLISSNASGSDDPFSALDKIVTLSELPQHCEAALQLIPKLTAKNETHEGGRPSRASDWKVDQRGESAKSSACRVGRTCQYDI